MPRRAAERALQQLAYEDGARQYELALSEVGRESIDIGGQSVGAVHLRYDASLYTGPGLGPGWAPDDVESGNVTPALEFKSPIKGPALEQICIQVGTGQVNAKKAAELYDKDVQKQAQQLGLPGW